MWRAQYRHQLADRELVWECDVQSRECPVAAITEDSLRWIAQVGRARRVNEATGGVLYGLDAGKWRARWYDAVEVIQGEIIAEETEQEKACSRRG